MSETLDVFPARVSGPGMRAHKARVFLRGSTMVILTEVNGEIRSERRDDVTDVRSYGRAHEVNAGEDTYTIHAGGGCGCGSRLRSALPADYLAAV